jgi:hypothetical protein
VHEPADPPAVANEWTEYGRQQHRERQAAHERECGCVVRNPAVAREGSAQSEEGDNANQHEDRRSRRQDRHDTHTRQPPPLCPARVRLRDDQSTIHQDQSDERIDRVRLRLGRIVNETWRERHKRHGSDCGERWQRATRDAPHERWGEDAGGEGHGSQRPFARA